MLPGMGKMLKNVDIPDDVFKQTEAIISSMTPAEREHPEIINARRRERIAKGSGTTMADVNQDDEGRGRRRHEDAQDAGRDDAAIGYILQDFIAKRLSETRAFLQSCETR